MHVSLAALTADPEPLVPEQIVSGVSVTDTAVEVSWAEDETHTRITFKPMAVQHGSQD